MEAGCGLKVGVLDLRDPLVNVWTDMLCAMT